MKNMIKILMLSIVFVTLGCSSDGDEAPEIDFYGNWFGTFDGDDSGTFSVFIHEDGSVTGDAVSNNLQQTLPLNGQINDSGNLNAVLGSAENGATFTGRFTETTSSGTWNNPSNGSGTWTGSKQGAN
ncbi:hypothetical protein [Flagellimonas nanhaiensis]|uniref:Lipoprotein n=1 Tax=Flagellimonas nanhaiensis TaxID=2292706 RepID=A0A371JRP6_9FLAO|nr:hypothetical protein [Allomuricauda nanhaiensis]RDY60165.1 hypothetical protein DX873_12610 [Allomuricauda nanhaiensis]